MLEVADGDRLAALYALGSGASLVGPVARGEVGQVWRLTSSDGTWAVKETFEMPSAAVAEEDAALQEAMAAGGLPVPRVLRTRSGDALGDLGSVQVRVYGWVDVMAPSRWLDPVAVGELVAGLHRPEIPSGNGVHRWYTDAVGAAGWDRLVEELVLAGAPFAEMLASQRDDLVALEGLLVPPAVLQACHRDLFADNVLRTRDGALCVIDWENSGLADPSQELAVVLFEFSCSDDRRARAIYEAYLEAGGRGRIARLEDFSMVIAQLGHIGEIACRRWLDPAHAAERARNAARVAEFLTERLTLELAGRPLDAIAT